MIKRFNFEMLPKALLLICLMLLLKSSEQVPQRRINFVVHNVSCVKLTNTFTFFECQMRKLPKNEFAFSGKLIFSKNIAKNVIVRFFIDFTTLSKKKLVRFVDIKMNMCEAISTKFDMPMLQEILLEIRRTSNIPYQCPLKANVHYAFENSTISAKILNKFLPYLHFVQGADLYESDKIIGSERVSGSILPN